MENIQFKETQKFNRIGVIALVSFFMLLAGYRFIEALYMNPQGQIEVTYLGIFLLAAATLFFLRQIRLRLAVNEKGIRYKMFPFEDKRNKIDWEDVKDVKVLENSPLAELSGWNVQIGGQEKNYSLSGRTGMKVTLKNGEKVFIGSNQPSKLRQVVRKFFKR